MRADRILEKLERLREPDLPFQSIFGPNRVIVGSGFVRLDVADPQIGAERTPSRSL
jgi:hypothetical protein